MQLKDDVAPYKPAGAMRVTRHDAGSLTELNYAVPLRCLELACISGIGTAQPAGGRPTLVRFAPGNLLYTHPGKKTPRLLRAVVWPKLESASRIIRQDPTQVFGFPFADSDAPAVDHLPRFPAGARSDPLLLAALLLVPPITLLVRRLRRRPPPVEESEPDVTPLERAVQPV